MTEINISIAFRYMRVLVMETNASYVVVIRKNF